MNACNSQFLHNLSIQNIKLISNKYNIYCKTSAAKKNQLHNTMFILTKMYSLSAPKRIINMD